MKGESESDHPELLFISSLFHDIGLTTAFLSSDKRFVVDGANAARDFLKSRGVPEDSIRLVRDAAAHSYDHRNRRIQRSGSSAYEFWFRI
ncbi:hypothetical protein [Paenibacillus lignilyticus]|uniref:hypothetical protein n=1 Tax=Paenibacillus lignilyticus TaxID=1172615 RepID=UPI001F0B2307|nr:hypothetical protein [Paenibacillus lignilyticus]